MMPLAEQVARALDPRRAERWHGDAAGAGRHLRTPDAVGLGLAWVVARGIVGAYYRTHAVDAVPSYDVERGWDRFVVTRRVSCRHGAGEGPEVEACIAVAGADAPILTAGARAALPLGQALRRDPEAASRLVLDRLSPPPLPAGDHSACWHEAAPFYPSLYAAVAELVLEHRTVSAAREVFVDDREIDGTFHPLYLHGYVVEPQVVYDWFAVERGSYTAYVRINGGSAVYQTDDGGWSTVRTPPAGDDHHTMKRRLCRWLRIGGRPDPHD